MIIAYIPFTGTYSIYIPVNFPCFSIYLSVCLSVRLSVCVSVCLCVCVSVCLSACLSVYLSVYLIGIYLSTNYIYIYVVHYSWVPTNHPKLDRFSIDTHGFGDAPILRTPPYIYIYVYIPQYVLSEPSFATQPQVPRFQGSRPLETGNRFFVSAKRPHKPNSHCCWTLYIYIYILYYTDRYTRTYRYIFNIYI